MAAANLRLKSEKFPNRIRAFRYVVSQFARERSELLESPVAAIVSIAILMMAVGTTAAT